MLTGYSSSTDSLNNNNNNNNKIIISILPYLTDEGEHTALYKINEKVYIKPEKY